MATTNDNNTTTSSFSTLIEILREENKNNPFVETAIRNTLSNILDESFREGNAFNDLMTKEIRDQAVNDITNLLLDENKTIITDENASYFDRLFKNALEEFVDANLKDNPFSDMMTEEMKNAFIDTIYDGTYNALDRFKNYINSIGDDIYGTFPGFNINSIQVLENCDEAIVSIKLNKKCDKDVVINLWQVNGAAKEGKDYIANIEQIIIKAGALTAYHKIKIIDDNIKEDAENFIVMAQLDNKEDFNFPENTAEHNGLEYYKAANITIFDNDDPNSIFISISNQTAKEGHTLNQSMDFTISLNRVLNEGEFLNLSVNGEIISFTAGQSSQIYTYRWGGNETKNEDIKFEVSASVIETSPNLIVRDINSGIGLIKDDDKDNELDPEIEYSPIVIDLNGDGINSLPLDYTINFDLDNNGFKEATGWVSGDDALLAIDKNNNGIIDNGSELFGNKTKSDNYYSYTNPNSNNGFETLKEFDTNSNLIKVA